MGKAKITEELYTAKFNCKRHSIPRTTCGTCENESSRPVQELIIEFIPALSILICLHLC